jgi:hypothetical protein
MAEPVASGSGQSGPSRIGSVAPQSKDVQAVPGASRSGTAIIPYKASAVQPRASLGAGSTLEVGTRGSSSDSHRPLLEVALNQLALCHQVATSAQMMPNDMLPLLKAEVGRRVGKKARRGLQARSRNVPDPCSSTSGVGMGTPTLGATPRRQGALARSGNLSTRDGWHCTEMKSPRQRRLP